MTVAVRLSPRALAIAALAVMLPAGALATPASPSVATSEWRNPSNTVHVRAQPCGNSLCGIVTWASEEAKADAADGGTPHLIGISIFHDFQSTGRGEWRGKVFVPDVNRTFAGTLRFLDADTMIGKGCVMFGLLCKSQTWSRLR